MKEQRSPPAPRIRQMVTSDQAVVEMQNSTSRDNGDTPVEIPLLHVDKGNLLVLSAC